MEGSVDKFENITDTTKLPEEQCQEKQLSQASPIEGTSEAITTAILQVKLTPEKIGQTLWKISTTFDELRKERNASSAPARKRWVLL